MLTEQKYKDLEFVEFMDVKVNAVVYEEVYDLIKTVISNGHKQYICLTDVENAVSATKDKQLKAAINSSLLSLADGAPLAYFARLAGYRRTERISGVRLMELLFAEKDGFSHYILGDTDQTIDKVISKARKHNEGISITGHSPPFRDFTDEDNCDMVEKIAKANPDIIWVCFGGRKQEKWMKNNIDNIDKGIMIGVGAALRWYTGDIKVPPEIFQKLCLQWFYRLVSELINEPRKGTKQFLERILPIFPVFIMNFPNQLASARRQYKKRKY